MRLQVWKHIFLTPFVRLNISNRTFSVSFGAEMQAFASDQNKLVKEMYVFAPLAVYANDQNGESYWSFYAKSNITKAPDVVVTVPAGINSDIFYGLHLVAILTVKDYVARVTQTQQKGAQP